MDIRFKDYLSERRSAVFEPIVVENDDQPSAEEIAAGILANDDNRDLEDKS